MSAGEEQRQQERSSASRRGAVPAGEEQCQQESFFRKRRKVGEQSTKKKRRGCVVRGTAVFAMRAPLKLRVPFKGSPQVASASAPRPQVPKPEGRKKRREM